MPAKKDGDSKQGLIITIVVLTILLLILGYFTYDGFAGQQKLRDDAKAAADKAKKADDEREWNKFQALQYKGYMGHQLSKPDQDALATLRGRFDSNQLGTGAPDQTEVSKHIKETLDVPSPTSPGWDKNQNRPLTTYVLMIENLNKSLLNSQQSLDKERQARANDKALFDTELATRDAAAKKSQMDLAAAQAAVVKEQGTKSKEYEALIERARQQEDQIEKLTKEINRLGQERIKLEQKLRREITQQETHIKRIREQLPQVDEFAKDTPDGRIVELDPTGATAWINLGSVDNVKAGLTFSVVGAGADGRTTNRRRGSLEVVNVLRDHLSLARITQVENPGQEPIVKGDLLYNPGWSANQREHVAITGLVDLSGQGRDTMPELLRYLRAQGMEVDAYLDLTDLQIKGPGMDHNTRYLIVGELPTFNTTVGGLLADRKFDRKQEVHEKVAQMRNEAVKLGVTIVPLRRFLTQAGYKLPPGAASDTGKSFEYSSGRGVENTEPGKKNNGKAKEDEEK